MDRALALKIAADAQREAKGRHAEAALVATVMHHMSEAGVGFRADAFDALTTGERNVVSRLADRIQRAAV